MIDYADDETVVELQNRKANGRRVCKADWVLTKSDADANHDGLVMLIHETLCEIKICFRTEVAPSFALAHSAMPLQAIFFGGDRFCIVLSFDILYKLYILCLRLQSYPPISKFLALRSFPESEDMKGKTVIDITRKIIFTDSLLIAEKSDQTVFKSAIFYLLAHEYAHIAHGHLDFLSSTYFAEFRNADEYLITINALEMDADASAAALLLDHFFSHKIELALTGSSEVSIEFKKTAIFRRTVFGIFCCILFSDTLLIVNNPKEHPITYIRYVIVSSVLRNISEKYGMSAIRTVCEEIRENLVEAFRILSGDIQSLHHPLAGNMKFYGEEFSLGNSEYHELGEIMAYEKIEPLLGRWARIRPTLETFLRGGKLAPAMVPPL